MEKSMLIRLCIAAAVLVLLFLFFRRSGDTTPEEARTLVGEGATILDVRTPQEYRGQHLPDAINIPVQQLNSRLEELGPKDKPIVIYCQSGMRSAHAAKMLTEAGFVSVHDLGSIRNW